MTEMTEMRNACCSWNDSHLITCDTITLYCINILSVELLFGTTSIYAWLNPPTRTVEQAQGVTRRKHASQANLQLTPRQPGTSMFVTPALIGPYVCSWPVTRLWIVLSTPEAPVTGSRLMASSDNKSSDDGSGQPRVCTITTCEPFVPCAIRDAGFSNLSCYISNKNTEIRVFFYTVTIQLFVCKVQSWMNVHYLAFSHLYLKNWLKYNYMWTK